MIQDCFIEEGKKVDRATVTAEETLLNPYGQENAKINDAILDHYLKTLNISELMNWKHHFDYKNHIKLDTLSKRIGDFEITLTQMHTNQILEDLSDEAIEGFEYRQIQARRNSNSNPKAMKIFKKL